MSGPTRGIRGGLTPERALALAGLAGLMLVFASSALMIAGVLDGEDSERDEPPGAAAPTATPTPTPTPEPTPEPLSAEERAARAAAADLVRSRGFDVVRVRHYDPRSSLRILLGRDASGALLAFFFVEGRYIGNDAAEPSARLRVIGRRERQVTLGYGVYAPGDERCCPSGGPVRVRFRLRGSTLVPLDPLPPAEQRTASYQPS